MWSRQKSLKQKGLDVAMSSWILAGKILEGNIFISSISAKCYLEDFFGHNIAGLSPATC